MGAPPPPTPPTLRRADAAPPLLAGAGLSGHLNAAEAAEQVIAQARAGLHGARPTVAFVFLSVHHVHDARAIVTRLRSALAPEVLVGVSGEAVLGGEAELEKSAGLALLALHAPGVTAHPFRTDNWPALRDGAASDEQLKELGQAAGMRSGYRGTFIFADPFSVPINALLPAMARARTALAPAPTRDGAPPPIIGGLASASPRPNGNAMILNDSVTPGGGVGVSLLGDIRIDALVSQGCKPIGHPLVITAGKGQMITGLGGRPSMQVLSEVIESLDEATREQLRRGLFVGRALTEYKDRFGRDDFLIRNVIGVEQASGAIAVADLLRVGQTIQFHVRDEATASEDLALLLDAQQLRADPIAGLLCTCNGRGTRMFGKPHHDASMVGRAFARPRDVELFTPAPGVPVHGSRVERTLMPLAGYFAGGEIGPIGDGVFVHGQSACLALFRAPGADS